MSPDDTFDSLDGSYNPGPGDLLTDGGVSDDGDESEIAHEFVDVIEDHIEFLEQRNLEYRELSREYESLQDDHGDVLDDHIHSLKDLRDEYRDMIDDHIDSLEEMRKEQRRISQNEIPDRTEIINERLEDLEDFKTRYRGLLEEYESLAEEHEVLKEGYEDLFDEHQGLHRDHRRTLRDFSDDKAGDRNRNLLEGALLFGTGLLSAQAYAPTAGAVDFYANAPFVYAEEPIMGILTLGLPAAGTYMFAKSVDDHMKSSDLEERAEELELQEKFEELREET